MDIPNPSDYNVGTDFTVGWHEMTNPYPSASRDYAEVERFRQFLIDYDMFKHDEMTWDVFDAKWGAYLRGET